MDSYKNLAILFVAVCFFPSRMTSTNVRFCHFCGANDIYVRWSGKSIGCIWIVFHPDTQLSPCEGDIRSPQLCIRELFGD